MKTDVDENTGKQRNIVLKASAILKYFLGTDDEIDTLIKCKPSNVELSCFDQSLYEALGSLKNYDDFDFRKLVKFLESVDIVSYKSNVQERPILTEERVEELRQEALKKK